MARILVTGAAGFIGRALCRELARRGHRVGGLTRGISAPIAGVTLDAIGEIGPQTDWQGRLDHIDVIIHLATRAHRPIAAEAANHEAAAAALLARAAAAAGVGRFVHVSSIRAMGVATAPGTRFHPGDPVLPADPYGQAKLAIERALTAAADDCRLDLVILRPPLVHGPGVKGNLATLIRLVASGLPLPFARIDNRRSLLFLDSLVELLAIACIHRAAPGRVLLARDPADLSTPELIGALAAGLGRTPRLVAVPSAALAALARLPALGPSLRRLSLSLQADDDETRRVLGWSPGVTSEAGLAATARFYARQRRGGGVGGVVP